MKIILFLFCFLPILSFGQGDTILIDSITLIKYNGSVEKKSLGYESEKIFNRKGDVIELYPNYDANRDMPLPVQDKTILDENGKFHPSVKWETYQTFSIDSTTRLLEILNCEIPVDVEQTGMCFAPSLGILVWSKGEIITFYSVCFDCLNVAEGASDNYPPNFKSCIDIDLLKTEIERLGYSLK